MLCLLKVLEGAPKADQASCRHELSSRKVNSGGKGVAVNQKGMQACHPIIINIYKGSPARMDQFRRRWGE